MLSVLKAQWLKDKRSPLMLIIFIVVGAVLTLIFGGNTGDSPTSVDIFSNAENATEIEQKWEALLNSSDSLHFVIADEERARQDVLDRRSAVAIQLWENDYQIIATSNMATVQLVEQFIHTIFSQEAQLTAISQTEQVDHALLRNQVRSYVDNKAFQLQRRSLTGEELPKHNMSTQLLFGFTLLLAMYTIGFKVNNVTADKVAGIWDRLILSPVSKTKMYLGYLIYSFLVGFVQISIVLLLLQYLMGYDLSLAFPKLIAIIALFTFSSVSLAMLFTGFLKTPEHFNMVYPSVIPLVPLIAGVYMPPGMLSNPILLFIADLFPLTHAMQAIMDVLFYEGNWSSISLSMALIALIGVICMGVGVNLVERRKSA